MYMQDVFLQNYRVCYVNEVMSFWSSQRCFVRLCIHNIYTFYMCNTALYTCYKRTFTYAPALETATHILFQALARGLV